MITLVSLLLEDPEGSKLMLTRKDETTFTAAYDLAPGAETFQMLAPNRQRLRAFLTTQ